MKHWFWIVVFAAAATTVASGATLSSRDGKKYSGQITVVDGRFAITAADGQTTSFAPTDISAIDFRETASATTSTAPAQDAAATIGTGLRGEYFSDLSFHKLEFVRGDPSVNFNFAPPNEPIPAPNPQEWRDMSVRWTGRIRPRFSERYTFFVNSDSLTRIWINHRLILDYGQSQGMATLEAGKDYDLRVDWVGHTRFESAVVEWNSQSEPREILPTECLFPPTATAAVIPPTALITAPAEGMVLAGPVDVPMSVAVQPGTSTPVQVAYHDGDAPIGVAKNAPFDLVWPHAPIGDHNIIATVTNADGSTGTSGGRHLIIGSDAAGVLPKPWVICDVPAPGLTAPPPAPPAPAPPQPVPPAAPAPVPPPPPTFQNGTLSFKALGGDVYAQEDSFRFVFQRLVGDGSIVARVVDLSADQKGARPLAGVMIRNFVIGPSAYVAMLTAPTVGDIFINRPTGDGQVTNTSSTGQAPVYLKLTRHGYNVRAYRSTDGQKWEFMGETTLTMPDTMLVGVIVCGGDPAVTAAGTFDHLAVTNTTDADTPQFQPAVVLTDGTRLIGAITKIANSLATITPAASPASTQPAPLDPLPLTSIARILFRPLPPDALSSLNPNQTGAFLDTGDFFEGEIDNLLADHVTVNSVVFGPRDFAPQNLSAIILHPISKPAAYEVTLSDGSVIESTTLSLTAAGLALHSAAGETTVALKDVQQIAAH
jgi:hypothetical protein